MKIILLEIIALICISAGIYFDQILVIFGGICGFYTCLRCYTQYIYIELLLLLTCNGLAAYALPKLLLGTSPDLFDILSYLMVIILFIILSNKISKIIIGNND